MPNRYITSRAIKNVEREVVQERTIWNNTQGYVIQKETKNIHGSGKEYFGTEDRNFISLDGGSRSATLPINLDLDIRNNIKYKFKLTNQYIEPLLSGETLIKEFYSKVPSSIREHLTTKGKIDLDKVREVFKDHEILLYNKINNIVNNDITIDSIALKWTGKDPDKFGRMYMNIARDLLFWISGGRIDYITLDMLPNGNASKIFISKNYDTTKGYSFNRKFYEHCMRQWCMVIELDSNSKQRKFNVNTLKFENEE